MPGATATLEESDLPELQRARHLWGQGRWDEAEAAFVRIAEVHPNNLHALVGAARVLGDRLQVRHAQALLDRLVVLAGKLNAAATFLAASSFEVSAFPPAYWRSSRRESECRDPAPARTTSRTADPTAHIPPSRSSSVRPPRRNCGNPANSSDDPTCRLRRSARCSPRKSFRARRWSCSSLVRNA
jgi:hypothetical protein